MQKVKLSFVFIERKYFIIGYNHLKTIALKHQALSVQKAGGVGIADYV